MLLTGVLVFSWLATRVDDLSHQPPRLCAKGNVLTLQAVNDGPFVVTHIRAGSSWTALEPPIAILESEASAEMDVRKLHWRNQQGESVDVPDGDEFQALFYRPTITKLSPNRYAE
ncbi:hypothetical protein BH11ARM2_BH11ARM2_18670 [soil metagenome]